MKVKFKIEDAVCLTECPFFRDVKVESFTCNDCLYNYQASKNRKDGFIDCMHDDKYKKYNIYGKVLIDIKHKKPASHYRSI